MKSHFLFFTVLAFVLSTFKATAIETNPLEELWVVNGLDQPESVVYDPKHKQLIVSNINGAPLELNQQGYLSRVSIDGEILEQHWVKNLNAPKGLAIYGDNVYVADMQVLHIISLSTGKTVQKFEIKDAKMLNDITVDQSGTVYVSDFLGGVIYRLENQKLTAWFSSEDLPHPNGLLSQQNRLLIGSWGKEVQEDFSTKVPGSLYSLDTDSQTLTPVSYGYQLGNLDGVVSINDKTYISDWISGDIYELFDNQRIKVLSPGSGVADIGAHDNMVFAPMMHNGQLIAWKTSN